MALKITHFSVSLGPREILSDINLEIISGKLHVLMGPNGSGKSTLAQALMGSESYVIQNPKSKIELNGKNISHLKTDERAREGLFLAFQNPIGIPGVNVANLLKSAYQTKNQRTQVKNQKPTQNPALSVWDFNKLLLEKSKELHIPQEFLRRSLNEEFSGGEKKKLEMLQALILTPSFAIFDEIDTGLDVDALKIVARGIGELKKNGTGVLVITHYQRILDHVKPDFVHILVKGKLVESGDSKLAKFVEKNGYKKWVVKD